MGAPAARGQLGTRTQLTLRAAPADDNDMAVEPDAEFEAVFFELYPRAVALAQRIVCDRAAAEDIAAEAFARAYLRWARVSELAWRDGWVLRTVTNLAIDATRRRRRRLPPPVAPTTFEDITASRLALTAAVRALPRRQREVVALRYLADLSEAEVAGAMRISEGSVKQHLHRGLHSLRAILGPDLSEGLEHV